MLTKNWNYDQGKSFFKGGKLVAGTKSLMLIYTPAYNDLKKYKHP